MAVSKTSICNLALSHFGGGKITSLDETTEKARQLSLAYDICLETALRDFPWNFARKIKVLGLTDDETPGWLYVYQYPADCVNLLKIYNENDSRRQEKAEFKIITNGAEKLIACDVESAYAEYTAEITTPNLYDPLFIKALSYLLAAEVCNALSGNSQKAAEMMQKYSIAINEAQLIGATENHVPYEWPTSYVRGRC